MTTALGRTRARRLNDHRRNVSSNRGSNKISQWRTIAAASPARGGLVAPHPLYPLRADVALPSVLRGPDDCSHGFQRWITRLAGVDALLSGSSSCLAPWRPVPIATRRRIQHHACSIRLVPRQVSCYPRSDVRGPSNPSRHLTGRVLRPALRTSPRR